MTSKKLNEKTSRNKHAFFLISKFVPTFYDIQNILNIKRFGLDDVYNFLVHWKSTKLQISNHKIINKLRKIATYQWGNIKEIQWKYIKLTQECGTQLKFLSSDSDYFGCSTEAVNIQNAWSLRGTSDYKLVLFVLLSF